jgi:hypothetical protein
MRERWEKRDPETIRNLKTMARDEADEHLAKLKRTLRRAGIKIKDNSQLDGLFQEVWGVSLVRYRADLERHLLACEGARMLACSRLKVEYRKKRELPDMCVTTDSGMQINLAGLMRFVTGETDPQEIAITNEQKQLIKELRAKAEIKVTKDRE